MSAFKQCKSAQPRPYSFLLFIIEKILCTVCSLFYRIKLQPPLHIFKRKRNKYDNIHKSEDLKSNGKTNEHLTLVDCQIFISRILRLTKFYIYYKIAQLTYLHLYDYIIEKLLLNYCISCQAFKIVQSLKSIGQF